MAVTTIEWADYTFNPWWGCQKVSPACEHCYAETFDKRIGGHHWGPPGVAPRRFFGEQYWAKPLKWNAKAERDGTSPRVFCASMADVFEADPDRRDGLGTVLDEPRDRLFKLILDTPNLIWMLLTKRPENIRRSVPSSWVRDGWYEKAKWPGNVWVGTTVESQEYADQRIPHLLKVPAAVRFLSAEPLLGALSLQLSAVSPNAADSRQPIADNHIHWVIAGGESGPGARPMHPDWARSLRDQCQAAGVAFFFKQWGEWKGVCSVRDDDPGDKLMSDGLFNRYAVALSVDGYVEQSFNDPRGNIETHQPHPSSWWMSRVGKHRAGRLLDGREWSEFPP